MTFSYLPEFARFILDERFEEYVRDQILLSREVKLPLLAFFEFLPEEELLAMTRVSAAEFLTYFVTNRVDEQIATSLEQWVNDQLPVVGRNQVAAEDITLVSYIRRQSFLNRLPEYTTDPHRIIAIVRELDAYTLKTETLQTNTYIRLLNEKLTEQLHFNEKITYTSPGVIYIFDLLHQKVVYSNQKVADLLGYTSDELQAMGDDYLAQVQHPDDIPRVLAHFEEFGTARDGEVRTFEHRLRDKAGRYRWLRNYESVFRRTETGQPWQLIGIALDIEQERLSEQALKKREAQLLEAQELANMGSFEWSLATQEADVSPQVLTILELEKGAHLSGFLAHVHPDDRPRVQEAIDQAVRENSLYDCEYRYLGATQEKIVWSRGTVVYSEGNPVMRGTVMDVTNRHRLLQQLRESDALYKQSQALTHIGNWLWEVESNRVAWSDELYRIYGLEPQSEEITFERFLQLVHPDDRERVVATVSQSLQTHQPNDFHHRVVWPDGTIRVLHAKGEVVLNEAGQPYRMVGTGQDVTEPHRLETELREKQLFIQKITDAAPSVITAYNLNTGVYTFVSAGLEKLLGYPPQQALDVGVEFIASRVHPDDLPLILEKNSQVLEAANQPDTPGSDETVAEFEYRVRHQNGQYRWMHTYGTVFGRDTQGRVEHVLNISVDITERVQAEHQLEEKTVQLERSNASLREFAYVASHDLKEPLRKISMFSDRLQHTERERISPDGQVFLSKIIDSSTRLQTMIGDILSISTLNGDRVFKSCDLQALIGETIQALEHKIEARNARVETDGLPVARLMPAQFRQLFLNLVSNSLKFSRADVDPHIRISHRFLKPDEVNRPELAVADRYLLLRVEDNGIGFDNRFANRIFAIFQRLHAKNAYEGNGIGLSICKRIVENHGGTVWAEGTPGQGAAFTIIIPQ